MYLFIYLYMPGTPYHATHLGAAATEVSLETDNS
jgi:hypothetical protein